jgi:hypothetical protein
VAEVLNERKSRTNRRRRWREKIRIKRKKRKGGNGYKKGRKEDERTIAVSLSCPFQIAALQ